MPIPKYALSNLSRDAVAIFKKGPKMPAYNSKDNTNKSDRTATNLLRTDSHANSKAGKIQSDNLDNKTNQEREAESKLLDYIKQNIISNVIDGFTELGIDRKIFDDLKFTIGYGTDGLAAVYRNKDKSIVIFKHYVKDYIDSYVLKTEQNDNKKNEKLYKDIVSAIAHEIMHYFTDNKIYHFNVRPEDYIPLYWEGIAEYIGYIIVKDADFAKESAIYLIKKLESKESIFEFPYAVGLSAAYYALNSGMETVLENAKLILSGKDPDQTIKMLLDFALKSEIISDSDIKAVIKEYPLIKDKIITPYVNLKTSEEVNIAKDDNWFVRANLALNKNLSKRVQRILAYDPNPTVQLSLINNYLNGLDSTAENTIAKNPANGKVLCSLAKVINLVGSAQIAIVKSGNYDAITELSKNPSINKAVQEYISKNGDERLQINLLKNLSRGNYVYFNMMPYNGILNNISSKTLDELYKSKSQAVRVAFTLLCGYNAMTRADNKIVYAYMLKLAKDKDEMVRFALALSLVSDGVDTDLSKQLLNLLKNDKSDIVKYIAYHSSFYKHGASYNIDTDKEVSNPNQWDKSKLQKYQEYVLNISSIHDLLSAPEYLDQANNL